VSEAPTPSQPPSAAPAAPLGPTTRALTLAALGVVFGDIGTSPLYAFRECFTHGLTPDPENILGILSLILWSLLLIVTGKYLFIVLRADHRGEGGLLALLRLVEERIKVPSRRRALIVAFGLFGSALFFGDGMITPAISVLSAAEGLELAAPRLAGAVLPLTMALLFGLFWFQSRGTQQVGTVLGWVTLAWFLALALLGLNWIVREPAILAAANPAVAARFLLHSGATGLLVLGGVFLVLTGAEALYADLGHFGRKPIRLAWLLIAFPALVLNYFGQGALLLADPAAAEHLFFRMAPPSLYWPLLILATAATLVASQAVISGVYSLTSQLMHHGSCPRMEVRHTSDSHQGQIYLPLVNWTLFCATIALILTFRSSSALAGAYGMAVVLTMMITTVLTWIVARSLWSWPAVAAAAVFGGFLAIESAFLGVNSLKILHSGWFPLLVGVFIYLLFSVWRQGRKKLAGALGRGAIEWSELQADLRAGRTARLPGLAVFMGGNPETLPYSVAHVIKHFNALQEHVVLMTLQMESEATVPDAGRVEVKKLGHGVWRVVARHGFRDEPSAPRVLKLARAQGLDVPDVPPTWVLGRESLVRGRRGGMSPWRAAAFAFMTRNAQSATRHFRIPPGQVLETGVQLEI